jgi:FkbM family methyltransferase
MERPDIGEFVIYGFDPNPRFIKQWQHLCVDNRAKEMHFNQTAAWTESAPIAFTLRPEDAPYGSSVMPNKRDWGKGDIIKVPGFDFSKWITNFVGHYVIVKMDIEGAEYPVLKKMMEDGTMGIMKELWVEWHGSKLGGGDYSTEQKALTASLKRHNVKVGTW